MPRVAVIAAVLFWGAASLYAAQPNTTAVVTRTGGALRPSPPGSITAKYAAEALKAPVGVDHVLTEVGPNHKTWAVFSTNAGPADKGHFGATKRAGRRVTEIATGMNYHDGQTWTPSLPAFEATGEAFVASRLQHKVSLQANLNTIGAVTLITPDGITLRSTPVAIGLYDAASGKSAIVAELDDCVGFLVSSNQVIYENAFHENGIQADVVYRVQNGSFEQDVIIRERLDVADYGFPAGTTRVQIFTEFYDAPQPDRIVRPIRVEGDPGVRNRMASPDLVDEVLGFGELAIATGRASLANADLADGRAAAPVAKQFSTIAGRTFLVEFVEYSSLDRELKALPRSDDRAAINRALPDGQKGRAVHAAAIPSPRASGRANAPALANTGTMRMAKVNHAGRPSVAIDYLAEIGGNITQPRTFQGGTTYVLTGPVTCSSAVTIEGGAVFKYPPSPTTYLKLNGGLTCRTSGYRPAIFTARDDNVIGEIAPGSTGTPSGFYANPALHLYYLYGPTLSNFRFSHCQEAVRIEANFSTTGATVLHSQFVNCVKGIVLTGNGSSSGGTATPLTMHNGLIANVQYPLTVNSPASGSVFYHCTIHSCTRLITAAVTATFNFVNSVFAHVPILTSGPASLAGSFNGFHPSNPAHQPQFGSPPTRFTSANFPFQTVDYGNRYLTDASGFRGRGTPSVPLSLLTALKTKTTQPPLSWPIGAKMTGELDLYPQVMRYVSGPPDLGYYYEALDFTVAEMISDGATIAIHPGTAIGLRYDAGPGFVLWKGSTFVSHGTPGYPNTFAPASSVQEGPYGAPSVLVAFVPDYAPDAAFAPPVMDLRFSNLSALPGDYHLWGGWDEEFVDLISVACTMSLSLRDCNLFGGRINLGKNWSVQPQSGNVNWINNLFDRVDLNLDPTWIDFDGTVDIDLPVKAYNNLFRGGRVRLVSTPTSEGNWLFKDNLFDKVAFEQNTALPLDHDFNGYWRRLPAELDGGIPQFDRLLANHGDGSTDAVNDKVLTSAPAYQSSVFGSQYLPASGPLYNGGSRTPAAAGLFHYTTRTDQTKEGAEPGNINIGLHYVAAAGGLPVDSDDDSLPDYVEDGEGDGLYEGEDALFNYDPDADGLDIWSEQRFGLSAMVKDNPLRIASVAPAGPQSPDVLNVTVTVAPGFAAESVSLYANGRIAPDTEPVEAPGTQSIVFQLDTSSLDNGLTFLEPVAALDRTTSQTVVTRKTRGTPHWITVDNPLTFKPVFHENGNFRGGWRGFFGDSSMSLQLFSLWYEEFQYDITIRSLSGQIVKTIGTGTSGFDFEYGASYINESWDLLDGGGQHQADDEFEVEFTAYYPNKAAAQGGAAGSRTHAKKKKDQERHVHFGLAHSRRLDHCRPGLHEVSQQSWREFKAQGRRADARRDQFICARKA